MDSALRVIRENSVQGLAEMRQMIGLLRGPADGGAGEDATAEATPARLKTHVSRILATLDLRSRVQAAILAQELGLPVPPPAGPTPAPGGAAAEPTPGGTAPEPGGPAGGVAPAGA
ncbi:response regulator transcription factor [Micromonospora thermarum]|uniref:Response regulator transcription factor n=1 Tax=Micromonospora thermarum TaxID=2720024 RepID=A0ABX0ZA10_9ACTN|nr:response regulator transcription factor [Micromonospora thermarum]NJP32931.1 response regulator transcription factor [Micromonospora thermarum]